MVIVTALVVSPVGRALRGLVAGVVAANLGRVTSDNEIL